MELLISNADIVIEAHGIKFIFASKTQQDLIYAMNLLDYLKGDQMGTSPIDKDTCVKWVFSKLKDVEGEIKRDGVALAVDEIKEMMPKASGKQIIPVVSGWAIEILRAHGMLEAEEKKA